MNKHELNKFAMLYKVDDCLNKHSAKVETILVFKETKAEYEVDLTQIRERGSDLENATSGKTLAKKEEKDELIDLLVPAASVLKIYGKVTGKTEIAERYNITSSDLNKLRDQDLLTNAKDTCVLVNSIATELEGYGFGADRIAALNTQKDEYDAALGNQGLSFAERSAARIAITELFAKIDKTLEKLDGFMELFRESDPDFYNEYKTSRTIKDLGIRYEEPPAPEDGEG